MDFRISQEHIFKEINNRNKQIKITTQYWVKLVPRQINGRKTRREKQRNRDKDKRRNRVRLGQLLGVLVATPY